MKQLDRNGLEYDELLEIQETHLALWKPLLLPEVYESTCRVCAALNRPTPDPVHGRHTVPRGTELSNLILQFSTHSGIALGASLE